MNLRSATLWLAAATSLAPVADAKKKGPKPKGPNAIKSACGTDANGKASKKCRADTSSFSTDTLEGEVTQFDFGEGNNFACAKKSTPHGSEFHGECSPGLSDEASSGNKVPGTANAITRGGKTYGSLHVGREVCRWGPDENGDDWVECLDEDEFPPEGDLDHDYEEEEADVPVPGSAEAEALDAFEEASRRDRRLRAGFRASVATPVDANRSSLRGITEATNKHRRLVDDAGGNLDVLVVWTTKAECRRSGLPAGCALTSQTEANMRALLDLAIEETNTAYDLSGIDTQLRLVHAYRHPNYVEASSNAFNAALNAATSSTDGIMDDVHDKRDAFGADLVAVIIDDSQYCGLAWMPSNPANSPGSMFSVTAWNCATGYYSFGHEIGHNLGCNHDRRASGACSNSNFNYGWRDPDASFRTTLAYNCGGGTATGTCVDEAGGGCSRIQRYSNPNFTYGGKSLGNANNDNARRINEVKAGVASFRPVVAECQSDGDCTDADACTTNVCDGVCLFEPVDCDDNNACTVDSCDGGNCVNDPVDCDDGNACTVDTCDPSGGCDHAFVANCCGNGVCEANESSGSCIADCSVGPFTVPAPKCNEVAGASCYIRDGHMFDVVAKDSKISITTLKLLVYQNGAGVEVWTRPGTYQGNEYSSNGWTKVADATSSVPAWNMYEIPEASFEPVAIEAGARQAFYVLVRDGNQLYYNSGAASTSSVVAEDDHLVLYEGHVMNPDFQGRGGVRVWSGDIVYRRETVQATPPPVPATPQPTSPPTPLPTPDPTPNPTAPLTPNPTAPPTPNPTAPLTPEPTGPPTPGPTSPPSPEPTSPPTPLPTADPTPNPTAPLTPNPTAPPTPNPTAALTPNPTAPPTAETPEPTSSPTPLPTPEPTAPITPNPTEPPVAESTPRPTSPPTPGSTSPLSPEPTSPPSPNPTEPPVAESTPRPTSPPTPGLTSPLSPEPTSPPSPNPTEPPVAESTPRPTSPPTPGSTSPLSPEPTSPPSPNPTLPVTPEPTSPPTPLPTADPTPNPTAPPTPASGGEPCTGPVLELYDFESGDYSNQVTGVRRRNGVEYPVRRPWTRRTYAPSVCGDSWSLMAGQSNNGQRGGVDDETWFTVSVPDGAGSFDFMYNRNLLDAKFDRFQVFVNGEIVHSFHGGNAQFVEGCMLATCVVVEPEDEVEFLCKNRGKEEWCSIDNLRFY